MHQLNLILPVESWTEISVMLTAATASNHMSS